MNKITLFQDHEAVHHAALWNKLNILGRLWKKGGIKTHICPQKYEIKHKSLSVCLLIHSAPFWYSVFFFPQHRTLRHIPNHSGPERETVIYLFILSCLASYPTLPQAIPSPSLSRLALPRLSSFSPPHWAENLCSLKTSEWNGATCGNGIVLCGGDSGQIIFTVMS